MIEIKGEMFGLRIEEKPEVCSGKFVQIFIEDDGNWSEFGNGFSSYWLEDLIAILTQGRRECA